MTDQLGDYTFQCLFKATTNSVSQINLFIHHNIDIFFEIHLPFTVQVFIVLQNLLACSLEFVFVFHLLLFEYDFFSLLHVTFRNKLANEL